MMTHASPLRFVSALLSTAAQKGPRLRCKVAACLADSLCGSHGPRLASALIRMPTEATRQRMPSRQPPRQLLH